MKEEVIKAQRKLHGYIIHSQAQLNRAKRAERKYLERQIVYLKKVKEGLK